jgi:PAS domain S-box-containing protein
MSAELYRALLENMTEGVSLSDEEGTIVYTNPAEDRMFGYEQGELIGQHVSVQNAYPPDENARIVGEVIAELKRSGAWRGEWLNRRQDGSTFVTTSRISAVVLEGRSYWLCIQEDVTDEKAAVTALEESRARLQLATEAAEIGIWDWDVLSGRMRYSARAKEICGFEQDAEVTYEDARRVTHPDDYPQTSAMARRALDPILRERAPYEYRIIRPDGTVRWALAHGEAVFAEVGGEFRAIRYVGTLQDISERVRLEEAERQGKARLALAIEASRMAVWEVDLATDQVTGSRELNRLLGFAEDASPTAEEMRARYYPGEGERLRALGEAALAGGERTLEAEYRYVWPDGSVRWLWLRAEFILDDDGAPVRAIGVLGDITERRRSEEALRASEARLKLAQKAAGMGVWDWDVETGAISWSPEMFEILGLDPVRDASAPYSAWLELVHSDDRDRANEAATRAASNGEPFTIDFRITRGNSGDQRWVRSHGVAVLDTGGRPARVVGVTIDITEERRREEELRELAGDLRSAVEASEKTRDRIYELSNDLFAVAGFDGYLKSINPAWERLLGYSREELLARPFATLIHPDDLPAAGDVIAAMQAGEPLQRFEDRLVKADGSIAWIAWRRYRRAASSTRWAARSRARRSRRRRCARARRWKRWASSPAAWRMTSIIC